MDGLGVGRPLVGAEECPPVAPADEVNLDDVDAAVQQVVAHAFVGDQPRAELVGGRQALDDGNQSFGAGFRRCGRTARCVAGGGRGGRARRGWRLMTMASGLAAGFRRWQPRGRTGGTADRRVSRRLRWPRAPLPMRPANSGDGSLASCQRARRGWSEPPASGLRGTGPSPGRGRSH